MVHEMRSLPDVIKARLAKRVRDVDFSVRTQNVFVRENIVFIGDLVQRSEMDLLGMYGFGRKCLEEVKKYLSPDFQLGMKFSDWSHDAALAIERRAASGNLNETDSGQCAAPEPQRYHFESLPDNTKVRLATRVKDIAFSVRTLNALKNEGLSFIGDVVQLPERELLGLQNFGRKSLAELKRFLAPDLFPGMRLEGWNRDSALELEKRYRSRIAGTRREEFARAMARAGPIGSLNDELQRLAITYSRNRVHANIMIALYGWDGAEPKTLEQVGQRFGITRERVRQIEALFLTRLKTVTLDLEWLEKARREILKRIPASESEIDKVLQAAGLIRAPLPVLAIAAALEIVGSRDQITRVHINGSALIVHPSQVKMLRPIRSIARRSVSSFGCCNIDDVCDEVTKEAGDGCSPDLVRHVLGTEPGFQGSCLFEWCRSCG
jgi:RNA polymerase alpha subunit/sigma-70-like protein